jgi:hypothetical protein
MQAIGTDTFGHIALMETERSNRTSAQYVVNLFARWYQELGPALYLG